MQRCVEKQQLTSYRYLNNLILTAIILQLTKMNLMEYLIGFQDEKIFNKNSALDNSKGSSKSLE